MYNIHNPSGMRLLTRLRLGLSRLSEHKFNHNFEGCMSPLCTCTLEIESTTNFFFHCHFYNNIRKTLLVILKVINVNILKRPIPIYFYMKKQVLIRLEENDFDNVDQIYSRFW